MTSRDYTVACLSGHGIAAEVLAEASRALARVSQLHGFDVRETHPPFGSEARTRPGTRCLLDARGRRSRAGGPRRSRVDPALEGVESELDLRAPWSASAPARAARSRVEPLARQGGWTIERAFASHARAAPASPPSATTMRWTRRSPARRRDMTASPRRNSP